MASSVSDLASGFLSAADKPEGAADGAAAEKPKDEASGEKLTPAQDAAATAVFTAIEKKDKPGFYKALQDCMAVADDVPEGGDELAEYLGRK